MSEQSIPISSPETQPSAVDLAEAVRWAEEIMAQEDSLRLGIIQHEATLMQLRRDAENLRPNLKKANYILTTKNKLSDEIMMAYRSNMEDDAVPQDIPPQPTHPPRSSERSGDDEVLGVPTDDFFDSVATVNVARGGLRSILNKPGARLR